MLKILKFKTSVQNVFFTSDLHLNHKLEGVWKSRGYASIEEHRSAVINKINQTVGANDILFNLGDFTLHCDEENFEQIIASIKCQNLYCLWGNHPNPSRKIYQRSVANTLSRYEDRDGFCSDEDIEIYPFRYKNLVFIGDYAEIVVDNQFIVLSHYPISIFNHCARGAWCCCGHSHYNFDDTKAETLDKGKIFDVGWDGHGKPLSFSELKQIMDKKQLNKVDHHV